MSKKHIAEQYVLKLPPTGKKPRYSYSQVERAQCGYRFYLDKTLKTQREETYNLAAGTMLDTAFNAYYEGNGHLHESHVLRMGYARAAVDLLLSEHPSWYEMPWSQKAGDVRSSPENFIAWLFDQGALELVCRHDRGPVEVQKKVEIELPDYFITGYIDCLELDTNTLIDIKCVTGYGATTNLSYALRSQVPLYRMLLKDTTGRETKGRYELLLCRKKPQLNSIPDPDIDYLQQKLIKDFDNHHKKLSTGCFDKNPAHCFDYNKSCGFLNKCWPELTALTEAVNQ